MNSLYLYMDRHVQTSCLDICFNFVFWVQFQSWQWMVHRVNSWTRLPIARLFLFFLFSFFIGSPLLSACRKTQHSVTELDTCYTEYCEGNYTFDHVDTNAKSPGEIPEGCEVKLDHVNWFRNQSTKLFEFRQINFQTIQNKIQFMPWCLELLSQPTNML